MSRRCWLAALAVVVTVTAGAVFDGGGPPRLPVYPDHTRLLVVRDAAGNETPVKTPADWRVRRDHVLAHVQEVMGPMPGGERRVPLNLRVLEEFDEPGYVRRRITYASEPGDRVTAWLLLPRDPARPLSDAEQVRKAEIEELIAHLTEQLQHASRIARKPDSDPFLKPLRTKLAEAREQVAALENRPADGVRRAAVLALHQTVPIGKDEPVGLGGRPTLRYGKELAERGYVVLAPDYPNFGEHKVDVYALGYASASMKAIWDNMRGVDLLQSLPGVDPRRIGVIGHSLGGHNSIYTAIFDERIQAAVSSCGFNAFPYYDNGDLKGWSHKGYMPRIASVYDCDPARMPFDFPELIGALAPRGFFTNSPRRDANFDVQGVHVCIDAATDVYKLLGVPDGLKAVYPDAEHDFPDEQRREAYDFLDGALRRGADSPG
jgi:dienelactone hydrolase